MKIMKSIFGYLLMGIVLLPFISCEMNLMEEEHYKKALKVRTLIKQDYERTYENYDVILSLASPILPFKLKSLVNSPVEMYMSDLFTVPINLAGLVSMCVPMGDVDGLPVGMQITGRRFGEETVIKAGLGYERAVK